MTTQSPTGAFCVDELTQSELQDRSLLNDKFMRTASTSEKIDDINNQKTSANLTYPQLNALHHKGLKTKKQYDNSGKTKEELDTSYTKQMGVDGMIHMLENKTTPSVTLEYVRQKHDKTTDWLLKTRGKRFYTQAQIVVMVEQQKKEMIAEYKSKGIYNKTLITNATTPYQQLNHLHHIITVNDRLDNMETRQIQQELMIAELSLRLTLTELNVEMIDNRIGISNADKKNIAIEMSLENMKQKDIAEKLNVSTRTIVRWLKEESR